MSPRLPLPFCTTPHECQRCGKVTTCGTYVSFCPWVNGLMDQMCDDCWNGLSVEEKIEMDGKDIDEHTES